MNQIPDEALTAIPSVIPTKVKVVFDWETLHTQVLEKGWVVVEVPEEDLRETPTGTKHVPALKAFVAYTHVKETHKVSVRRVSKTRWFIAAQTKQLKGNKP